MPVSSLRPSPGEKIFIKFSRYLTYWNLRIFTHAWEVDYGDEIARRYEQGVLGSTHGIVAMSTRTMSEPWVQAQYHALLDNAVARRRRIIPVLIGSGDAVVPPFLRTRQAADLRGLVGTPYQARIAAIARALRGQRPGPPFRLRRGFGRR